MLNPIRGEATAKVGDVTLTLAMTMQGLANLSSTIKAVSLEELYQKLVGFELTATMAAIQAFTTGGKSDDAKDLKPKEAVALALKGFSLSDCASLQAAFSTMMVAMFRERAEEATQEEPSPNG